MAMKLHTGLISGLLMLAMGTAQSRAGDTAAQKTTKSLTTPVIQSQNQLKQVAMGLPAATIASLPMLQVPTKSAPAPAAAGRIPSDHDRIRSLEYHNFRAAYP